MNPFTLVNGEPYPLDMRGELDDTAAFKNFKTYTFVILKYSSQKFSVATYFQSVLSIYCYANRWGNIEFPLPFGRVLSPTEGYIHLLDEKVIAYLFYSYLRLTVKFPVLGNYRSYGRNY